jgi:hypothetical protein
LGEKKVGVYHKACSQKYLIALIILSLFVFMSVFFFGQEQRIFYNAVDFSKSSKFADEFEHAREQNLAWTKNPREVAERFLQYHDTQFLIPTGNRTAIVIMTWRPVGEASGDSVSEIKVRVDLRQYGDLWEVEWVGQAHKCFRDGHDIGGWLYYRNPFPPRGWTKPLHNAIYSIGHFLNPWHTKPCP